MREHFGYLAVYFATQLRFMRAPTLQLIRKVAIAEGISYLAFAVTMPLKYGFDIFWPNKIIGWAHGALFILYWIGMLWAWRKLRWSLGTLALALLASLIPFAPFYVDRKLLRDNG